MAPSILECRGDPRQQGQAQGVAWHAEIQERVREEGLPTAWRGVPTLRPLAGGPVLGRGPGREVLRHYTHLAERMAGLARASRTPLDSVMSLFLRAANRVGKHADLAADAIVVAHAERAGSVLVRSLSQGAGSGPRPLWRIRRSRPEVGFASLELTLPWFVSAVAGVNEAGVTAAVAPGAAPPGGFGPAHAAPSAELLVQECLQRFDGLDACVEWCTKRPAGGAASLLLGDASGEVALVSVAGSRRQVQRSSVGPLVGGAPEDRRDAVRKTVEETGRVVWPLEGHGAPCVRVDSAGRALLFDSGTGSVVRYSVDA